MLREDNSSYLKWLMLSRKYKDDGIGERMVETMFSKCKNRPRILPHFQCTVPSRTSLFMVLLVACNTSYWAMQEWDKAWEDWFWPHLNCILFFFSFFYPSRLWEYLNPSHRPFFTDLEQSLEIALFISRDVNTVMEPTHTHGSFIPETAVCYACNL